MTVDGISPSRTSEQAYGSAISLAPTNLSGYWIVIGEVKNKEQSFTHTRALIYRPGDVLYVIDSVKSLEEQLPSRQVRIAWHFDESYHITKRSEHELIGYSETSSPLKVQTNSQAGEITTNVVKGLNEDGELLGWVSHDYLSYEPTTAVTIDGTLTTENMFLTSFHLSECDSAPLVELKNNSLTIHDAQILNVIQIALADSDSQNVRSPETGHRKQRRSESLLSTALSKSLQTLRKLI